MLAVTKFPELHYDSNNALNKTGTAYCILKMLCIF